MKIDHYNLLAYELEKTRIFIENKDEVETKALYETYTDALKTTKTNHKVYRNVNIYSKEISYHCLSIYLLLDVLDYFWDGKKIKEKVPEKEFFFMKELDIEEDTQAFEIDDLNKYIDKISSETQGEEIHIFLIPYKYEKKYVVKTAKPGHIIMLYGKHPEVIGYALAELSLEIRFRGHVPPWASSKAEFIEDLVKRYKFS